MPSSSIPNFMLVIVTLLIAISAFVAFSLYTSFVSVKTLGQEYVIGLSKSVQISLSPPTYSGIPPGYNYFNVSFLLSITAPLKYITVIPFVAPSSVNPSTATPLNQQNATLNFSTPNGYKGVRSFRLSATVYLPQGNQYLTTLNNVYAYNVSANSTYVLFSTLKNGQLVYLWVLFYYEGKWYRLDFTYVNPFSAGIGLYALSGSGLYNSANPPGAKAPHYVTTQKGFMVGLWFEPIASISKPITILNVTITVTGQGKPPFGIIINQTGSQEGGVDLVASVIQLNGNGGYSVVSKATIASDLTLDNWYFLNFSFGSQLGLSREVEITVFNQQGEKITQNPTILSIGEETNGYVANFTFGSKRPTVALISQAFFVSLQSENGINAFYDASNTVLENGYKYDNSETLYNIISGADNELYAIGYWYFMYASYPPPTQISGILWYWSSNTLYTATIPEIGQNTYVLV
ncbi:MAG: hypothetical protein OWQ54_10180 [Sulfolobaceae archaeon]|nr:hypothetical protein [Sulfolobaceae archaeon]